MIGKVTRGSEVGGLLRYLYGPGKANEHTNPHLVASWQGDNRATLDHLEPTPGLQYGRRHFSTLATRLTVPMHLNPSPAGTEPEKHVWQCSMRLANTDRPLTDTEWAHVAREVVDSTGFAPAGDPGGCRWVAVRHAEDHIHIAVVLARIDGQPVNTFRDWPKVHAAARTIEQKFGLTTVPSPDATASVASTRAEIEKAGRFGGSESARAWLTREVRTAAAGSSTREQFERFLTSRADVVIAWRDSTQTPGEVTGYRVGRAGDVDAHGVQIWFSGSKLSPDLSLPKLTARWAETGPTPLEHHGRQSTTLHHAAAATTRAADQPLTPAIAGSAAEVATSLARLVEGQDGGPLTQAADDLARAARQPHGDRPTARAAWHDLRYIATGLAALGRIAGSQNSEVLVIVASLAQIAAAIAAARTRSGGSTQAIAARRAATTLTDQVQSMTRSQADQLRAALGPQAAAAITIEPAWPTLAVWMKKMSAANIDVVHTLRQAAGQRELTSAQSVAAVLTHRLQPTNARPQTLARAVRLAPRPDRGRHR